MTADASARRLLFVHAHPDDETLATGVAIAHCARSGHEVHVLTCTLGEEGEVIPPELGHLGAAHEDRLGGYRLGELRGAVGRLGAIGHLLGVPDGEDGPGPYRDSGMAGTPSAARPDALAMAPLQDVVAAVRTVMQRLRPDVVVTYDPSGGYGHPDHIVVHRATVAAAAGLIEWSPRVFAAVVPRSWATADRTWVLEHVAARAGVVLPGPGDAFPPSVVEDNPADVVVTGCAEVLRMRDAALREHRTQVSLHDGFYTLSNLVATRLPRREAYRELDQATGGWRAVAPPQVGTPTARGLHDDEEGDPRCS